MGLTWDQLLPDYVASLNDAASTFKGTEDDAQADFRRHLLRAADALSREKRTLTAVGELQVSAGVAMYDAPANLLLPKLQAWSQLHVQPWDAPNEPMPAVLLIDTPEGKKLRLQPAPSPNQIRCFGSAFRYYYLVAHAITEDAATSTLTEGARHLLYLRAQAEAMRELAFRGYAKPVTLRAGSGVGASPARNMTPAALHQALLDEYGRSC
ncbi:hypothetical protein [Microcystis phage vB_MaeS-yong1]|nr:hypothetical protein [Microcystis phage vB_MaeS-yong1]